MFVYYSNCLNRGGILAQCGVLNAGSNEERNYDIPKNALGGPMATNIQSTYEVGSIIDVEVQLTAHHQGHFIFKACPISNTTTIPTQECFDKYPLQFISDELYGAPVDTNHPYRVYVAPVHIANKVTSTKENFDNAMVFQYKLQLPIDLSGDLVLLQWYYVASNSACIHEGYDTYPFPNEWIATNSSSNSEWSQVNVIAGKLPCDEVLPKDGNGIPEQFWYVFFFFYILIFSLFVSKCSYMDILFLLRNCAEISIVEETTEMEVVIPPPTRSHSKTIIGYYASWQWYDRNKLAAPINMDFTKVTRV